MCLVELGGVARGELLRCFLVDVSAWYPHSITVSQIVPVPLSRSVTDELAMIDIVSTVVGCR